MLLQLVITYKQVSANISICSIVTMAFFPWYLDCDRIVTSPFTIQCITFTRFTKLFLTTNVTTTNIFDAASLF